MNKTLNYSLVVLSLITIFGLSMGWGEDTTGKGWTPINLTLYPPYSLFNTSTIVNGVDLGLYGSFTRNIYGLQFMVLSAYEEGGFGECCTDFSELGVHTLTPILKESTLCGIQISGYTNMKQKLYGIQIGGLTNTAGILYGIQLAGVGSLSENQNGITVGGIGHYTDKALNGIGIDGLISCIKTLNGIQIVGLFNFTEKTNGIQIGLINYCEGTLKGVQIGGFNMAKKGALLPYTIGINVGF